MAVTNKAEAEALSVEELKTELESRGLPTEGLKQAIMLETLLKHLESAAETNGDAEKETEASNGDSKKDVAPENGASREGEDAVAKKEEPKKDEEAVPAEPAKAGTADGKAEEEPVAPAAEGSAPTRPVDEVSGGTEQPDAKKPKADADPETAEAANTAETPAETPAAESTA